MFESLNTIDCRNIPCLSALERGIATRGSDFYYDSLAQAIIEQSAQSWYEEFAINLKLREVKSTETGMNITTPSISTTDLALVSSPSLQTVDLDSKPTTEDGIRAYSIPFSIPLFQGSDEVGDINLTNFIKLLGDSTMKIYNAILANKRVLFVGYNHSAASIAQMVLSAVCMVAPVLPGIIRRVFPYANLTDLSFLEVPGYIAGVTNPMFQENEKWWDIVCVLDMPNSKASVRVPEPEKDQKPRRRSGTNPSSTTPSGTLSNSGSSNNLQAMAQDTHPLAQSTSSTVSRSRMGQLASRLIPSSSSTTMSNPLMYDVFDEDSDFYQYDLKFIHTLISTINANSRVQGPEMESWLRIQFREYSFNIMRLIQIHNQLTGRSEAFVVAKERSNKPNSKTNSKSNHNSSTLDDTADLRLENGDGIQDSFRIQKLSPRYQKIYERNLGRIFLLRDLEHVAVVSSGLWLADLLQSSSPSASMTSGAAECEEEDLSIEILVLTRTIQSAILKLQMSAELNSSEVELILSTIDKFITTESRAQLLLYLLPENQGGLHCIGAHMLHESPYVRKLAFFVLQKISCYSSTRPGFSALNFMLKSAYQRLEFKVADDSISAEILCYKRRQAQLPGHTASLNLLDMLSDTAMGAIHSMQIPFASHSASNVSHSTNTSTPSIPTITPSVSQSHPPPKPPRPQRGSSSNLGVGVASLATDEGSRHPSSDAAISEFELLH